jgi:hypothetical protein
MTNRVFGLENSGRSLLTFHCIKAHVHHRARQTGQFPVQTNNELTPPARFVAVPCPRAREPCVPPLHRVSFFRQPLYISLSAGVIHSPFRRKPRRVRGRTPSSSSLSSWCQSSRLPSASERFKTIQVRGAPCLPKAASFLPHLWRRRDCARAVPEAAEVAEFSGHYYKNHL